MLNYVPNTFEFNKVRIVNVYFCIIYIYICTTYYYYVSTKITLKSNNKVKSHFPRKLIITELL